jgi:hypothetical protein
MSRTDDQLAARLKSIEEKWGQGNSIDFFAPSLAESTRPFAQLLIVKLET